MPVIKSKMIRVRDPETGFWHDLPATVSEESFRAAERAVAAEATAVSSAASAASSASDAASSAESASGSATTAGTQAGLAAASAESAAGSASTATSQAEIASSAASDASGYASTASSAASTATTKAGLASDKADAAYASAQSAEGSADTAVSKAGEASDSATAAASSATAAEAWAAGTSGGTPSETNNAAYYATQAASSATAAGTSEENAEAWATGGSSGTPSATNNAKYYSEEAADSATAAATSASASESYAYGTNFAPAFSASTAYKAGDYVVKDGVLYRFTADHAAGAWTGSDAVAEKIAPVVADLKTQYDANSSAVFHEEFVVPILWENGSISSGTEEVDDAQRKRSAEFMDFWNAEQINITVPTGKRIITFVYSAPNLSDFESTITWKTVDFSIVPNGKYYRFTISDDPEGETRVSEDGFIFSGETYAKITNDATNERVNSLISIGHNLLNPDECVDKITISTTGVISTNSSYWASGFIDVGDISTILLPTAHILREVFYDSTKETAVGYIGGAKNPVNIPAGAKYMRVVFYKNDVDYNNRESLSIVPSGTNTAFESYHAFNSEKTLHDKQYFFVNAGTYTESFTIHAKRGNQGNKNMIIAFKGYYTGISAPTIQFFMKNAYADTVRKYFTSQIYVLGNDICTENKEWRVPAFPPQAMDFDAVITIPTGTELYLEYLYNKYDDTINRNCQGYILEAHLGTLSIYPQNTLLSFHSAAKLGYPACVAVPKKTSDGVWVCFHDDANVGNLLRYPDGSTLSTEDAAKRISDFTFAELMAFSAGAKVDIFYAGEKVPKLESFFSICQKTGMHPVLSIHPIPSASEWAEIKALAKKYNVLQTLAVKIPSVASIGDAYNVLGDDIEFYIYENGTNNDNTASLIGLGLNLDHAKLCTEYFDTYIDQAKVTNGLNSGLVMGCYVSFGTAARYNELMEMGVTFITDDNNNSYGLNW